MKTKRLVILIGNIGSGKTTLAKRFVEKGYVVISRDALRYMIGGGKYIFDKQLELSVWAAERAIFEIFVEAGLNIVVDGAALSKRLRGGYFSTLDIVDVWDYKCIAVVLPRLSMSECVERRMKDPHQQNDKNLWEGIWEKFDSQYEEPSLDEGFDKIIQLQRNSNV
jgi:predicted kinase